MSLRSKSFSLIGIFILLTIAWAVVQGIIGERSSFREAANISVAHSWTGKQTLTLPILVVPYQTRHQKRIWDKAAGKYQTNDYSLDHVAYLPLSEIHLDVNVDSNMLDRGIFKVPVFHAQITLRGKINFDVLTEVTSREQFYKMGNPYLSIGVSDQRGITEPPKFRSELVAADIKAGSGISGETQGFRIVIEPSEGTKEFSAEFSLKGTSSIEIIPTAQYVVTNINSNWQHPSFIGAFLPVSRSVDHLGYKATWTTNQFSSAVEQVLEQCSICLLYTSDGHCEKLQESAFGVKQIDPVDHYMQSERATKYGLLTVLLVFACFILVELLKQLSLHPINYMLVGFSLTVFHLLLISLAEHIGFGPAYLISTLACTAVISLYVQYQLGLKTTAAFSFGLLATYSTLYVVILSEDYAFISGALIIFFALTAVMMVTRKIDWNKWHEDIQATEDHSQPSGKFSESEADPAEAE